MAATARASAPSRWLCAGRQLRGPANAPTSRGAYRALRPPREPGPGHLEGGVSGAHDSEPLRGSARCAVAVSLRSVGVHCHTEAQDGAAASRTPHGQPHCQPGPCRIPADGKQQAHFKSAPGPANPLGLRCGVSGYSLRGRGRRCLCPDLGLHRQPPSRAIRSRRHATCCRLPPPAASGAAGWPWPWPASLPPTANDRDLRVQRTRDGRSFKFGRSRDWRGGRH